MSTKYSEGVFPEDPSVTLGGSYIKKEISTKDGHPLVMHIWDTAGSESSRPMLPLYYRDSSAGLITYDIGNSKSFENIDYWAKELTQKLKPDSYVIAIVGNKADLPDEERQVPTTRAYQYAKEKGYMFIETSAKTGAGVDEIFEQIAERIYKIGSVETE